MNGKTTTEDYLELIALENDIEQLKLKCAAVQKSAVQKS